MPRKVLPRVLTSPDSAKGPSVPVPKAAQPVEDDALDPLNIPGWDLSSRVAAPGNVMSVVFVGSECAPWVKTGGLGDVMQSLPKALAARGHRVMVIVPKYGGRDYKGAEYSGVIGKFNVFGQLQEVGYHHLHDAGVDWVFLDHGAYESVGKDIYAGTR